MSRFLADDVGHQRTNGRPRECVSDVFVLRNDEAVDHPDHHRKDVNVELGVVLAQDGKNERSEENGHLVSDDKLDGVGILAVNRRRPVCQKKSVITPENQENQSHRSKPLAKPAGPILTDSTRGEFYGLI